MKEIARAEKIAVDEGALAAIAYRADGGLRDALTMLEQLAAFSGGTEATVETLDLAFGSTGRTFARALVDAILARDSAAALAVVAEASDAGTDLAVLIRLLIAAFRNLLVARVEPALLMRDLAAEDAERVTRQAQGLSQATLVRALRAFGEALSLTRLGGNARLELETALLRFTLATEDPTLEALAARVATLEERAPAARSATPAQPVGNRGEGETASKPPAEISVQKVRAAWQSVCSKVEGERQSLRAPLSRAAIETVEGNAVVLKLPNTWSADALREYAPLIERAIADVLGVPLKVTLRVDGSAGRSRGSASGNVASMSANAREEDGPDALFDYANERIR